MGIITCFIVDEIYPKGTTEDTVHESSRDELLHRSLVALILTSDVEHPFSNFDFTNAFLYPARLTPEERSCLNDFSAALCSVIGDAPALLSRGHGVGNSAHRFATGWSAPRAQINCTNDGGLPAWLVDAGVTFHFEEHRAG